MIKFLFYKIIIFHWIMLNAIFFINIIFLSRINAKFEKNNINFLYNKILSSRK